MEREPAVHFATHDDPYELDRVLSAERAEHAAIIARQPAEVAKDLVEATERIARLTAEQGHAAQGLAIAERELRGSGRSSGSAAVAATGSGGAEAVGGQHERAERIERDLAKARAELARHDELLRQRLAWSVEHGWRAARVTEIDGQLALHWRDAVLAVTRQDDPLAFGIDRLRQARLTTVHELHALDAALPPDRSDAAPPPMTCTSASTSSTTRAENWPRPSRSATKPRPATGAGGTRRRCGARSTRWRTAGPTSNGPRHASRPRLATSSASSAPWSSGSAPWRRPHIARAELAVTRRALSAALDETRRARLAAARPARGRAGAGRHHRRGATPARPAGRCGAGSPSRSSASTIARRAGVARRWRLRARSDDGRLARLVADADELIDLARRASPNSPADVRDRPTAWRDALSAAEGALETARPRVVEHELSLGMEW